MVLYCGLSLGFIIGMVVGVATERARGGRS